MRVSESISILSALMWAFRTGTTVTLRNILPLNHNRTAARFQMDNGARSGSFSKWLIRWIFNAESRKRNVFLVYNLNFNRKAPKQKEPNSHIGE
jgi:hypothetical protein